MQLVRSVGSRRTGVVCGAKRRLGLQYYRIADSRENTDNNTEKSAVIEKKMVTSSEGAMVARIIANAEEVFLIFPQWQRWARIFSPS
jgi:hypothetical protein